jgi:hypothetical protein
MPRRKLVFFNIAQETGQDQAHSPRKLTASAGAVPIALCDQRAFQATTAPCERRLLAAILIVAWSQFLGPDGSVTTLESTENFL